MAIHQKAVCYGQIIFLKISTSLWNSKLTSMENIIVGSILEKSKNKSLGRPYQINIGRGVADEPVGLHLDEWLDKGDIKDKYRKPLKWNTLRIKAVGPEIKSWLNGELIVSYKDPSPRKDLLEAGAIGFQTYGAEGHAGWVHFRNISIIEIKPEKN